MKLTHKQIQAARAKSQWLYLQEQQKLAEQNKEKLKQHKQDETLRDSA